MPRKTWAWKQSSASSDIKANKLCMQISNKCIILSAAKFFFRGIDESFRENFTSLSPDSIGNSRLAALIAGIEPLHAEKKFCFVWLLHIFRREQKSSFIYCVSGRILDCPACLTWRLWPAPTTTWTIASPLVKNNFNNCSFTYKKHIYSFDQDGEKMPSTTLGSQLFWKWYKVILKRGIKTIHFTNFLGSQNVLCLPNSNSYHPNSNCKKCRNYADFV